MDKGEQPVKSELELIKVSCQGLEEFYSQIYLGYKTINKNLKSIEGKEQLLSIYRANPETVLIIPFIEMFKHIDSKDAGEYSLFIHQLHVLAYKNYQEQKEQSG